MGPFKTITDVDYATAGRIDRCNNHRSLHGGPEMTSLSNTTPPTMKSLVREILPIQERQKAQEGSH